MAWKKLGHVFYPEIKHEWMQTHASTPTAVTQDNGLIRIYFSTRNARNQSCIIWLDMQLHPEIKIISVADTPVLLPGKPGYFDDNGVTISQIIRHQGADYLYYIGWNLTNQMPFRNSIGLALSKSEDTCFQKYSPAPIIDRSDIDPLSLSYPWINIINGQWHMWYGSHVTVEENGLDVEHVIKYAHSNDGISWHRKNHVCVSLNSGESGIVRPCVIYNNDEYHMWYSIRMGRKETYRIGYARSDDGLHWDRIDHNIGIDVSSRSGDWDAEMICYPFVFDHMGERYMLYNGNGFGRTGFGLAVLE